MSPTPSPGNLTTTEFALLGMLARYGEHSGYELLKLAENGIGFFWLPAKSHVYAVLPRLQRTGHARRRLVAQTGRPEKRFDRAKEVAREHRLLVLGRVPPAEVPLWVNAADAVLVTSERESFGLSVLEALACDVPVLATDVGIAPEALADVRGAFCGPFSIPEWRAALDAVLAERDPRVAGRQVAERYSADRMAELVLAAWRGLR